MKEVIFNVTFLATAKTRLRVPDDVALKDKEDIAEYIREHISDTSSYEDMEFLSDIDNDPIDASEAVIADDILDIVDAD